MIDVSAGLSDSIHKPIDASYYPDGWRRYMARAIKEVFPDKIVMTSGDIRNPQSACGDQVAGEERGSFRESGNREIDLDV